LAIILYGFGIINLLLNWFPNPGPGTMGTVPMTFLAAILLAIINFIIIKRIKGKRKLLIYGIAILTIFTIIAIGLYPQEKPLTQIKTAINLWWNPDKIKYEDLFRLNYQDESTFVTAALAKYRDSIPEQAFNVSYCCEEPTKKYFIARYENEIVTNNKELIITRLTKDSIEFADSFQGEEVKFNSPKDVFGNSKSWGTYINLESKRNTISFNKCKLEPLEGFNSIYYTLIK